MHIRMETTHDHGQLTFGINDSFTFSHQMTNNHIDCSHPAEETSWSVLDGKGKERGREWCYFQKIVSDVRDGVEVAENERIEGENL